jgi:hypothetical protein
MDIFEYEAELQEKAKAQRARKNIREIVGFGMVEAMEKSYETWLEKKTTSAQKRYLTWRLRFRLRFNHMPDVIERLEESANVGLFDEEVGPLYDEVAHTEVWTGKG